jgi:hypothetical protein
MPRAPRARAARAGGKRGPLRRDGRLEHSRGLLAALPRLPWHHALLAAYPPPTGSVEPAAPPGSELVTPPHAHFAHAGMIAVGAPLDGAPPPHGSAHGALPAALPTLAREAAAREAAVVPEKAPHTMAMAAAAALAAPPPGGGEAAAAAAASRTASGEGEDGGEAAVQPARERLLALRTLLTEGLVRRSQRRAPARAARAPRAGGVNLRRTRAPLARCPRCRR